MAKFFPFPRLKPPSIAAFTLLPLFAVAQVVPAGDANFDVAQLSLEDLLQIRITSVSRKEESLFSAPAAVFVISSELAHRTGSLDLPSALRIVPGVNLGYIDTTNKALSPRGFNDISANKLLALIDGRSVYTPLFGGVLWRLQATVMEDVQRIEVIRGPGSTLWGANAVNGVVNVTTKSAHDTLGTLLSASIGDWLDYSGTLRHGFAVDDRTDARIYAQSSQSANYKNTPTHSNGAHVTKLTGFRSDHRTQNNGTFTVTGQWLRSQVAGNSTKYTLTPPYLSSVVEHDQADSVYLLSAYKFTSPDGTDVSLQTYVDYLDANRTLMTEKRSICDIDTSFHREVGHRQDWVAGAGFRYHGDKLRSGSQYQFDQAESSHQLFTLFGQDEITIIPERFTVTLGTKLEHNDYTGWELQPGIRAVLKDADRWVVWSSIARAVRTPGRAERGTRILPQIIPPNPLNPLPTQVEIFAANNFDHEELVAYEAGFRAKLNSTVSVDIATYLNVYDGIRSVEPLGTHVEYTPVPHVVYSSMSANGIRGQTYGVEAMVNWTPLDHLRFQASYAGIHYNLELAPGSMDVHSLAAIPGSTPASEYKLLTQLDLGDHWQIDLFAHHQTALTAVDIPAYTGLDLRIAWLATSKCEVSFIGNNLLEPSHPEFPPTFLGGATTEIPRTLRGQVTWRF